MTDLSRLWGIRPGPWLWGSRVRILFVIDGRVNLQKDLNTFGLGLVLDTLRDESVAWWARFEVDVADRDGGALVNLHPGPYGIKFRGFRFTRQGFDIDAYDQIWFFGDKPGQDADEPFASDAMIERSEYKPLDDAELEIVAEWMDRGGGVFATGDHSLLGASMSFRIPRVRTMRKWKFEHGVPTFQGATRHETLQPGSSSDLEGDALGQPIEPVFRKVGSPPFFVRHVPHPILCAAGRVIDVFPDHMHEGEVIEDADVDLDRPLDIPDYDGVEYPPEVQVGSPVAASAGAGLLLERPRPQVIAHGRTTNQENPGKRFALISVYDGDRARIGRIVVDSTWHHWFSMNTRGFKDDNPSLYASIQAYHRNVALWLARPEQRVATLIAASWGVLTGLGPMAFQGSLSEWEIGERTIAVIGRTLSACMVTDLVATLVAFDAAKLTTVPLELAGRPVWSRLPEELLERAIVGGIGSALRDLALDHYDAWASGERPRLDPDALRVLALQGAAHGHRLLVSSLEQAVTETAYLRDRVASGLRTFPPETIPVPVESISIRVIPERLQFPDASDPALLDDRLTISARLRIDDAIVATRIISELAVPTVDARGGVIELDGLLGDTVVQSGETLTIEVLVGAWELEEVSNDLVRFQTIHCGSPSGWLGRHAPGRAQPWRLWYRIEPAYTQR
jgi:hypothetical protein